MAKRSTEVPEGLITVGREGFLEEECSHLGHLAVPARREVFAGVGLATATNGNVPFHLICSPC